MMREKSRLGLLLTLLRLKSSTIKSDNLNYACLIQPYSCIYSGNEIILRRNLRRIPNRFKELP